MNLIIMKIELLEQNLICIWPWFHLIQQIIKIYYIYSSLKWTVLSQSGRSMRVKLKGHNEVDGSEIKKWTVQKAKTGRSQEMKQDGNFDIFGPFSFILWIKGFNSFGSVTSIHKRPLRPMTVHFGSKDHPLSSWNVQYGLNDSPVRLKTVHLLDRSLSSP